MGLELRGVVAHLAVGRGVADLDRVLLLQAGVLAHLLHLLGVGLGLGFGLGLGLGVGVGVGVRVTCAQTARVVASASIDSSGRVQSTTSPPSHSEAS